MWGDAEVEILRPYGALELGFDVDDIRAPGGARRSTVKRRHIPLLTELRWVWDDAKVETLRPYGREEIGCQAGVTFRS